MSGAPNDDLPTQRFSTTAAAAAAASVAAEQWYTSSVVWMLGGSTPTTTKRTHLVLVAWRVLLVSVTVGVAWICQGCLREAHREDHARSVASEWDRWDWRVLWRMALRTLLSLIPLLAGCGLGAGATRTPPARPFPSSRITQPDEEDHHQDPNDTTERRARKTVFRTRAGKDYGYADAPCGDIDTWRQQECPRLVPPIRIPRTADQGDPTQESNPPHHPHCEQTTDDEPEVYLDYAGAALPTQSQLLRDDGLVPCAVLANPHSTGPAASRTRRLVQRAHTQCLDLWHGHPGRRRIGGRFHPNDQHVTTTRQASATMDHVDDPMEDSSAAEYHPGYELVFTSGATEALRIVADRFPWRCGADCDCHNRDHDHDNEQETRSHKRPIRDESQGCRRPTTTNGMLSSLSSSSGCSSALVYAQNAHTSVVGMRAPARQQGAHHTYSRPMHTLLGDIHDSDTLQELYRKWEFPEIEDQEQHESLKSTGGGSRNARANLLVLPLECNFTGERFAVQAAIGKLRSLTSDWYILLDVAKAASTGPIHLCELDCDFACVSFYKLFGAPTGLGCLLVKRTSVDILTTHNTVDRYFGGGSVDAVLAAGTFHVPRSLPTPLASLEHGTPHFRGIVALLAGFRELDRLGGMRRIHQHTSCLAQELVCRFRALMHGNERPVVVVYGPWNIPVRNSHSDTNGSSVVAFNVVRADGTMVGYNEVSKLAALNRPSIQLRSGCFCNPGACQIALGLSNEEVVANYHEYGHVCGDHKDIVNGKPTGALRASFGKDSIWEDMDALVTFVERYFVNSGRTELALPKLPDAPQRILVSQLFIFPIKSCAAQRVQKWKYYSLSGRLMFDREFALVDSSGSAMRLQSFPNMAFILPSIDLATMTMTVDAPNQSTLRLNLDQAPRYTYSSSNVIKVCGNKCEGFLWGDFEVSEWFSRALGVRCWLARCPSRGYTIPEDSVSRIPRKTRDSVAFANEQPLLLISEHAVDVLNELLKSQGQTPVSCRHFRPNIVVQLDNNVRGGADMLLSRNLEDGWTNLTAADGGKTQFEVVGPCARCAMVDVDPSNGRKGKTLRALSEYRRFKGQISFGIFLRESGAIPEGAASHWAQLAEGDTFICS